MRRRTVVGLTASTLMGVVFLVAMMPVATRQGINCRRYLSVSGSTTKFQSTMYRFIRKFSILSIGLITIRYLLMRLL